MQNVELRELQLESKWISYLIKAGYLTASEVLLTPPAVLAKKTKLPLWEMSQLLSDVSLATMSMPLSKCWTISEHPSCTASLVRSPSSGRMPDEPPQRWITSGDDGVDALLGNGIPLGTLTEIAGQSQVAARTVIANFELTPAPSFRQSLPPSFGGVSGGTLFISSEGIMPSSRLVELARHLVTLLPPGDDAVTCWDFLDNVHTEKAQDVETLESLLSYIAPAAIERVNAAAANGICLPDVAGVERAKRRYRAPLPIKLIIVDSIAAPFRVSHANNSAGFASRAKEFGNVGHQLKRLAHVFDCAVVVVNQISDAFIRPALNLSDFAKAESPSTRSAKSTPATSSPRTGSQQYQQYRPAHEQNNLPEAMYSRYQTKHFSGQTAGFPSVAALGHSWSNIVNTRIMMRRGKRRRIGDFETPSPRGKSLAVAAGATSTMTDENVVLVRHMSMVFSPFAERSSLEYIIDETGVRSLGMPVRRKSLWRGDGDGRDEGDGQPLDETQDDEALWAAVDEGLDENVFDQGSKKDAEQSIVNASAAGT
ncbi:DNA repair protein rhp57 [Microbotryomycetes sp. JL201]|nr:DNA repair protein rhp57 [Microbotryomycetes sp. JL201]